MTCATMLGKRLSLPERRYEHEAKSEGEIEMKRILPLAILPLLLGQVVHADSKDIYQKKCMACHASGVAGAPKLDDQAAWTSRLAERGLEGLYNSALKGRNAMPPKGTCFDCTDEQIKQVVDFMVQSQK